MRFRVPLAALCLSLIAVSVLAGQAEPGAVANKNNPALAPIKDEPNLPRVLLIGDSISMGYTLFTRELLKGEANVHRIPENGGPTSFAVEKIDGWLNALGNGKWDVIHFNWGLHDIKIMNGKHQVEIEQYEKNLRTLVEKMKATGATLIWASTTPVPEGKLSPLRKPGDEIAFNAIAKKIMDENGVETNDLYAFCLPKLAEIQQKANVHFFERGSVQLAEQVAKTLRPKLKKAAATAPAAPAPVQQSAVAPATPANATAAIRYLPASTTAELLDKVNDKQWVPFGWKAFELPGFAQEAQSKSVDLSWPTSDSEGKPGRLRLTIAVDMREECMIVARSSKTLVELGKFDIRYASNLELFEIKLTPEHTLLALQEGVSLKSLKGGSLWILATSTEPALNPHILIDRAASPRDEFFKRMNSLACIQQFGWMEGCVLDGLLDLEAVDPGFAASHQARSHLDLFTNAKGDLIYEDPTSLRKVNSIAGIEATLPFAAIAKIFPTHPSLKIAQDFWTRRAGPNGGLIMDGQTVSSEGCYTVAYPLAVLSKLRKDEALRALAFTQLRERQRLLAKDGGIHQRGKADGSGAGYKNWARGMAWYMLGFARTLAELKEHSAECTDLRTEFLRAAEHCVELQQPDGLWRNFAHDPKTIPDTSGSAGIAAALAIGVNHGLLPTKFLEPARKAAAAVEQHLTPDGFLDGAAQSNKGGEGLQRGNYRVIYQMGMGLYAQLLAALKQADQAK